jgi:hypothetical protein
MRTTLELDGVLLDEAVKLSGEKGISSAVDTALLQCARRRELEDVRRPPAEAIRTDTWREDEQAAMEKSGDRAHGAS